MQGAYAGVQLRGASGTLWGKHLSPPSQPEGLARGRGQAASLGRPAPSSQEEGARLQAGAAHISLLVPAAGRCSWVGASVAGLRSHLMVLSATVNL